MDIATRCELLARDVATTLELPWAIRDLDGAIWSTPERPDGLDYLDRFDPDEAVVIVDGSVKVLDGGTPDEIVTDAADEIATKIMDQLNRPWPETLGGQVLQVGLVDGEIWWTARYGERVCQLGDLYKIWLKD